MERTTAAWHSRSWCNIADTPAAPRLCVSYSRSDGEAALQPQAHHRQQCSRGAAADKDKDKDKDDDDVGAFPALMRPQFTVLDADALRRIELRMQREERMRLREQRIDTRAAAAAGGSGGGGVGAYSHGDRDVCAARLQRHARRHAAAAEAQMCKRIAAEYRTLCRW